MMVKVKDLRERDYVDLEGDPYADPQSDKPEYEFEYAIVAGIERETPTCVRVDFETGNSVGFPPDHEVDVDEVNS
jgi:hypothetical protein